MLVMCCRSAHGANEGRARRAEGFHHPLRMHLALDGHVHIRGPYFVNSHHLVILELLTAWVDVSAARAQVQNALATAECCLLRTPSIALFVSPAEVLHLDNVPRHVVGDELFQRGDGFAALTGNVVGVGWNVIRAGALGADGVEAGEETGILADEALPARTLARRGHGGSGRKFSRR